MFDMRKLFKSTWSRLVLLAAITLAVTSVARLVYSSMVWNNNVRQITELNLRTLHRAEAAVDYAVDTLASLQLSGLVSCDAKALEEIRRISFLRGSIKDIQVLDASHGLLCAGGQISRQLGVANFDFSEMYAARDENIFFHDITRNNSGILGVARHIDAETTFLAVLNLDSLLFGIFPEAVRNHARADLVMGGEVEVASQIPDGVNDQDVASFKEFRAVSDRYPLEVVFTLDADILRTWNRDAQRFVDDFSLVLGLLLGWMALVKLAQPRSLYRRMKDALRRREFVPFMQPTFSVEGRRIIGCEVLARWVQADGTIVPPHKFIPFAEDNGLIVPMTRMIIRAALEQLREQMKADKDFKVAFNVVPSDLLSDRFEKDLVQIVQEVGVARRQIVIEITERQEFADQEKARSAIARLRELGFRVALDDTGVGHNGLSNVHLLGADIIKIDKIFVDRVGVDASATTIVQMLVRLARELGMRTVAEGIETEEQLAHLVRCDVDEGQGYLISRPVPVGEFLGVLAQNRNADRSARPEADGAGESETVAA